MSRSWAASRPPSLGMLVCKLPLYHIIMRCLGYQQISRRLGREGCSTIRKCQLAASSFCRSLNPIFLTCISATGTGPLHSDKPPGEPQQEHCDGDPTALLSQCPQTPAGPQAELQPSHRPAHGAPCGAAGLGGLCAVTPAQTPTQPGNREHLLGHQACACVHGGDGQQRQPSQRSQEGTMLLGDAGYTGGSPQGPGVSLLGTCCRVRRRHRGAEHQQGDTACVCWGHRDGGH